MIRVAHPCGKHAGERCRPAPFRMMVSNLVRSDGQTGQRFRERLGRGAECTTCAFDCTSPTVGRPPPPPRGEAGNEIKPRPPSVSPSARRGRGTPGPLRSVTSMRMTWLAVLTATVTVSPGSRAAVPDAVDEKLVHQ